MLVSGQHRHTFRRSNHGPPQSLAELVPPFPLIPPNSPPLFTLPLHGSRLYPESAVSHGPERKSAPDAASSSSPQQFPGLFEHQSPKWPI